MTEPQPSDEQIADIERRARDSIVSEWDLALATDEEVEASACVHDVLTLVAALRDARAEGMCDSCSNYHAKIHHGCCASFVDEREDMAQEIDRLEALVRTMTEAANTSEAEVDRLIGIVQRVEAERDTLSTRLSTMRTALSFVHAWPDGVTGKRMVDADDILTILEADKPRAALTGGTDV